MGYIHDLADYAAERGVAIALEVHGDIMATGQMSIPLIKEIDRRERGHQLRHRELRVLRRRRGRGRHRAGRALPEARPLEGHSGGRARLGLPRPSARGTWTSSGLLKILEAEGYTGAVQRGDRVRRPALAARRRSAPLDGRLVRDAVRARAEVSYPAPPLRRRGEGASSAALGEGSLRRSTCFDWVSLARASWAARTRLRSRGCRTSASRASRRAARRRPPRWRRSTAPSRSPTRCALATASRRRHRQQHAANAPAQGVHARGACGRQARPAREADGADARGLRRDRSRRPGSRGRVLMIGQTLRFWPEYVALANYVKSGALGAPLGGAGRSPGRTAALGRLLPSPRALRRRGARSPHPRPRRLELVVRHAASPSTAAASAAPNRAAGTWQ